MGHGLDAHQNRLPNFLALPHGGDDGGQLLLLTVIDPAGQILPPHRARRGEDNHLPGIKLLKLGGGVYCRAGHPGEMAVALGQARHGNLGQGGAVGLDGYFLLGLQGRVQSFLITAVGTGAAGNPVEEDYPVLDNDVIPIFLQQQVSPQQLIDLVGQVDPAGLRAGKGGGIAFAGSIERAQFALEKGQAAGGQGNEAPFRVDQAIQIGGQSRVGIVGAVGIEGGQSLAIGAGLGRRQLPQAGIIRLG